MFKRPNRVVLPDRSPWWYRKIVLESDPQGEVSRVQSNLDAGSTPGGALPIISLSFSFVTILPPEPKRVCFREASHRVIGGSSADR